VDCFNKTHATSFNSNSMEALGLCGWRIEPQEKTIVGLYKWSTKLSISLLWRITSWIAEQDAKYTTKNVLYIH